MRGTQTTLLLACLMLAPNLVGADEVISSGSKTVGSAGYSIEFDDVRDRLIHYDIFPVMAYFGRGITLGFAGGVDLRPLPWLGVEIVGQGPYKTFIQNPNGPFIVDAALVLGGSSVETGPTNVELKREAKLERLSSTVGLSTTKTLSLQGIQLSEKTRSPVRLGARLYHGSTDPAAPSGGNAVDKRVDGTILWGYVGFGVEQMENWKVLVERYGARSARMKIAFGMDLMYAPIRDYAEDVSNPRDDFLFPLGARVMTRVGSLAPLGVATRFEVGLNGAGAGWYAMLALGVGGSAVPIGTE